MKEIDLQRDYLQGAEIQTVYLGGGTPSLLNADELNRIFDHLHRFHQINPGAEITLEANPDDLSRSYLETLRQSPVNRLSIGIQSFSDQDLRFMNRAHGAHEARACIEYCLEAGFDNLTIDLIYGSPTTSDEQWLLNLETAVQYKIPHLSCYCLTVEPNTALDHFVRAKKAKPVDDVQAARQFEQLLDYSKAQGYEHYEISNFARPRHYSRHNSSYWKGIPYLGLGPSAHSFNGESRQWNIANNAKYIDHIQKKADWFKLEKLSPKDKYNEYVLTSLRTIWGCNLQHITPAFKEHFQTAARPLLKKEFLETNGDTFLLTRKGKLFADQIALELFLD